MSTTKKKSTAVKKSATPSKSVKKALPKAVSSKQKTATAKVTAKKTAPKKTVAKVAAKIAAPLNQDKLTKDALKLVDRASTVLRKGIKTSSKATHEARASLHQEAHSLLGEASAHLESLIKSGTSFLRSAIGKI